MKPLIVGLTGGIASGKTTVADLFAARGVPLVDADVVAREVVEPGEEGLSRLAEEFGPDILSPDRRLDRAALRKRIFAAPEARRRVEAMLHPLIRHRMEQRLAGLRGPYLLLVAPLLLEAGLEDLVDRVLVVDAAEEAQVERLMRRDASDPVEARAILAAQLSRQERLARADDVIANAGTLAELEAAVEALHRRYLKLAAR